jgi:hypothetical protein
MRLDGCHITKLTAEQATHETGKLEVSFRVYATVTEEQAVALLREIPDYKQWVSVEVHCCDGE